MALSGKEKRMARMILLLRQSGVTSPHALEAMETVDRSAFIDGAYTPFAYENAVIPIAAGQTLARPAEIGALLQAAEIVPNREARILLVGAGCGYLAALLAQLSKHVYAVERFNRLVEKTTDRLAGLGIESITLRVGDGLEGWPEKGPFDRIILSGSVARAPEFLCDQLTDDGLLVCPVRRAENDVIIQVGVDGTSREVETGSKYQRLVEGEAEAL